jgi:hypothetical protein
MTRMTRVTSVQMRCDAAAGEKRGCASSEGRDHKEAEDGVAYWVYGLSVRLTSHHEVACSPSSSLTTSISTGATSFPSPITLTNAFFVCNSFNLSASFPSSQETVTIDLNNPNSLSSRLCISSNVSAPYKVGV